MADLSVSFQRSISLIERHFQRHSERINELGQNQDFSLSFFIEFYRNLVEEIQQIFDMDDDEFGSLTQTREFQSKILNLLDKVIMLLANKAYDARLYPPKKFFKK